MQTVTCRLPDCSRQAVQYRNYCAIHFCGVFGVIDVFVDNDNKSLRTPFANNKISAAQIVSNGLRRMRGAYSEEKDVASLLGILNHISTVLTTYDIRRNKILQEKQMAMMSEMRNESIGNREASRSTAEQLLLSPIVSDRKLAPTYTSIYSSDSDGDEGAYKVGQDMALSPRPGHQNRLTKQEGPEVIVAPQSYNQTVVLTDSSSDEEEELFAHPSTGANEIPAVDKDMGAIEEDVVAAEGEGEEEETTAIAAIAATPEQVPASEPTTDNCEKKCTAVTTAHEEADPQPAEEQPEQATTATRSQTAVEAPVEQKKKPQDLTFGEPQDDTAVKLPPPLPLTTARSVQRARTSMLPVKPPPLPSRTGSHAHRRTNSNVQKQTQLLYQDRFQQFDTSTEEGGSLTDKAKSNMLLECIGLFGNLRPLTCNCDETLNQPSHVSSRHVQVCPVFLCRVFWTSNTLKENMTEMLESDNTLLVSNALKFVWALFVLFHKLPLCTRYSALNTTRTGGLDQFLESLRVMSPRPWAGTRRYLHPILFDTCLQLLTNKVMLKPVYSNFLVQVSHRGRTKEQETHSKMTVSSKKVFADEFRNVLQREVAMAYLPPSQSIKKKRNGKRIDMQGKFSVELFSETITNSTLIPHIIDLLRQTPCIFTESAMRSIYSMMLNKATTVPPVELVLSEDRWLLPILHLLSSQPYKAAEAKFCSKQELKAACETSKYCKRFIRYSWIHIWNEESNDGFRTGVMICDCLNFIGKFSGGWTHSSVRLVRTLLRDFMKYFTTFGVINRLKNSRPGSPLWNHTFQVIAVVTQFVLFTGYADRTQIGMESVNVKKSRSHQVPRSSLRPTMRSPSQSQSYSDMSAMLVANDHAYNPDEDISHVRMRKTFASVSRLDGIEYYLAASMNAEDDELDGPQAQLYWQNELNSSVALHAGMIDLDTYVSVSDAEAPCFFLEDLPLIRKTEEVLLSMGLRVDMSDMPDFSAAEKKEVRAGHRCWQFFNSLSNLFSNASAPQPAEGWTITAKKKKRAMSAHGNNALPGSASDLDEYLGKITGEQTHKLAQEQISAVHTALNKLLRQGDSRKVIRGLQAHFPYLPPIESGAEEKNVVYAEGEKIVLEGVLNKETVDGWKKTWIRLTPTTLSYAPAPHGQFPSKKVTRWQPMKIIQLKNIAAVRKISAATQGKYSVLNSDYENAFVVDSTDESFVVTGDLEFVSRWLHFLELCVRNIRFKHGTHPTAYALARTLDSWTGDVVTNTAIKDIHIAVIGLSPVLQSLKLRHVTACNNSIRIAKPGPCKNTFGILEKKHHCRSCGLIFCRSCLSKQIVLKHTPNISSRVCLNCVRLHNAKSHGRLVTLAKLLKTNGQSKTKTGTGPHSLGKRGTLLQRRSVKFLAAKSTVRKPSTEPSLQSIQESANNAVTAKHRGAAKGNGPVLALPLPKKISVSEVEQHMTDMNE